jgi:hypothetical protein
MLARAHEVHVNVLGFSFLDDGFGVVDQARIEAILLIFRVAKHFVKSLLAVSEHIVPMVEILQAIRIASFEERNEL